MTPRVLFEIEDDISTSAIDVGRVTGAQHPQLCTGGRDGVLRLYDADQDSIRLLASLNVNGSILSIRIADANNDGIMEVVIGRSIGPGDTPGAAGTLQIYRYAPSGMLELLAEHPVDRFVTSVYVTDVTGDNKNEILAGGSDSTLRIFSMDTENNLTEYAMCQLEDMPLAIGTCDVIGDEIEEIVTGSRDKTLRVFKVKNQSIEQIEMIELPSPVISVASGDILGDRKMELGVVTHDGSVRIYRNEESKLDLFSKLDDIKAQSVRMAELNADHMDEVVIATSDHRILFYNLYMAELTRIAEVEVGSRILSINVGDSNGSGLKEVLVGVSNAPLKVINGLYQIIPQLEVTDEAKTGVSLVGRLTISNVTDAPVTGISGKIYWFPKDSLDVNPQQLRLDIGPRETKVIEVQLHPKAKGAVVVRPIVLMWTDSTGQVRQVTTPEMAIVVEEGSAIAAPATEAPADIQITSAPIDSPFASAESIETDASIPSGEVPAPQVSGDQQLREAEQLLDKLFGEQVGGAEILEYDEPTDEEPVGPDSVEPEPVVPELVEPEMEEAVSSPFTSTPTVVEPPTSDAAVTEPAAIEWEVAEPIADEAFEVASPLVVEIRGREPKPPRPGATSDSYAYLFKTMVIGEGAVGKTALVNRYTTGAFEKDYKTTIGSQFAVKLAHISPPESEHSIGIKLQAWDVAGQARFKAVRKMYYSGAAGVIIIFDVTRRRSFAELVKWVAEADESIGMRVPMICVGNKIDLPDRAVPYEESKKWAEEQGFLYMESSAKTGEGVADMFTVLAEIMWREARRSLGDKKKV